MAEILLYLTIIGVVAAITLPSLTGNINERTWNTQRKALFSRLSQAVALMPSLNSYGTLTEGNESTSAVDTAAETFITEGLSKVLKINNICDSEHLADCGIPSKIIPFDGGSANGGPVLLDDIKTLMSLNDAFTETNNYSTLDTKVAAFETINGESILVYYNPKCISNRNDRSTFYIQQYMCANFVYDLNGIKGPNTMGKDLGFISALYASDPTLSSAIPLNKDYPHMFSQSKDDANSICKKFDSESRLPTVTELASIFFNKKLTGTPALVRYWSGTPSYNGDPKSKWVIDFINGRTLTSSSGTSERIKCIKK